MEFILVTGTTFSAALKRYRPARRAADMVGRALARAGFGLVTGSPPGVDSVAAASFFSECRRLGRSPEEGYRQLWLPHLKRGYWLPGKGYPAPRECLVRLRTSAEWTSEAISAAGAAVMIGGRGGALSVARRFIDAGKPVFPIPFSGGESRGVFHEILKTWEEAPVPGLSRSQFLRLDIPWIADTGALEELLLGTLARVPDVFICYRRDDVAVAAGRLHADLAEHFGHKRVFMDLHDIAPSATWRATIASALEGSRIGIVVIGSRWLAEDAGGDSRLLRDDDVVRQEVGDLLRLGKHVMPVLVAGARLPSLEELPEELRVLTAHQAISIDNANWETAAKAVIRSIESALESDAAPAEAP